MLSQTEIFLAKIKHMGRKKLASLEQVQNFKQYVSNAVFEERKLVYPCLFLKMIFFRPQASGFRQIP